VVTYSAAAVDEDTRGVHDNTGSSLQDLQR
jgi:hypothetical protein